MTQTIAAAAHSLRAIELEQHHRRYAQDAWSWVAECVWTVDEADSAQPIKPFPVACCLRCSTLESPHYLGVDDRVTCPRCGQPPTLIPYLPYIARAWQDKTPPILYLPKPRRMRLSWLMVALHGWLCLFHSHVNAFIQSSKQEKSVELLNRLEGILTRIPGERFIPPIPDRRADPPRLIFPNKSQLIAVPEGPDQLRQFTATAIMADEIATWHRARETYTAMKPCIEGGGQITLISSAYPGFWREAIVGELTA